MMETWKRAVGISLLAIYFFAFIEWLFFFTKPSFLSMLGFSEAVLVLSIAPLPYVIFTIGVLAGLLLVERGLIATGAIEPPRALLVAYALLPAIYLASAFFLMIENFTYTIFGFGVIVVRDSWRVLYGIFFLVLLLYSGRVIYRRLREATTSPRWYFVVASWLLVLSTISLLFVMSIRSPLSQERVKIISNHMKPPDVILISGDALEVSALQGYQNPVKTIEPFPDLGRNTVVFENSFPNSNTTAGSTALVLTGKHALTTKKYHGYRFFSGKDAYQHLPGLLRARGYRSIQIGSSNHVNAGFWGMMDAFDVRNLKRISNATTSQFSSLFAGRMDWELHFSQILFDQVWQRLEHSFGGRRMTQHHLIGKPGDEMTGPRGDANQIVEFLQDNPGPVFAQMHSMSTRTPTPFWLQAFAKEVNSIIDELKAQRRFKNSIIVIWSDHGQDYATNRRLPLIIKFPKKTHPINLTWNAQTIDIPPTILESLGLSAPSWMEGRSLLGPIDRYEPIFSSKAKGASKGIDTSGALVKGGLVSVGAIICNRWYRIEMTDGKTEAGWVEQHTTPCAADELPSDAGVYEMILGQLAERGYDSGYLDGLLVQ